ncbi:MULTISPECIES: formate/nitrite transporter family protein [Metabacillus]|uniref:Formate/nitrite transporter family protein n=1 Tax=Metabacillus endolithicus TaxID=1535204 RepID=A0ABW5C4J2_9BACI|nr:formate/nitrite transporter family protein [Metabacillus endolithicus]UPG61974.1 formate/nitrite transporter family protein [Metabacillus endolithicus]
MIENNTKKQDNEAFHEPSRQYFNPAQIVHNFSQKGRDHLNRKTSSQFILSLQAGAFMAFGAAFSILLSMGIDIKGVSHLMAGVGFATGYAMVFLSGAILFTEVNVLLPSYLFQKPSLMSLKILKFWLATYLGNIIGALFVGTLIVLSKSLSPEFFQDLNHYINHNKMSFLSDGTWGFFEIMISGILANWLIGMAAFLTTAARDITGKIIGTLLPVILFVAGNFQHSAANMGYFSIGIFSNDTYDWYQFFYNLIPASIGNIIGGAIMVALLFSFAYNDEIQNKIK